MTHKCKILEGLNWQTEMELADLQVQKENELKPMNSKAESKKETKELLAAKEEIRSLKNKVEMLEKQKKNLKESHEQKEGIYSKMIIR